MTVLQPLMKQSTASLARWLKLLLWALLLQASLQQTALAGYYFDCRISLQADPPLPANIATQQTIGTVIYQGTLTWNYTECIASMSLGLTMGSPVTWSLAEGSYSLLTGTSTPQPIWGVSGLTVQAAPPVFGKNFINTSDHQVNTNLSDQFKTYFIDSQLPNMSGSDAWSSYWHRPPVSFSVSQTITIKTNASMVSGKFPDPKNGGPLISLELMGPFKTSCRVGPWTLPIYFSSCAAGPGIKAQIDPWVGKPVNSSIAGVLIDSTPQVPTIGGSGGGGGGGDTVVQNCKPVLSSTITVTNRKTP